MVFPSNHFPKISQLFKKVLFFVDPLDFVTIVTFLVVNLNNRNNSVLHLNTVSWNYPNPVYSDRFHAEKRCQIGGFYDTKFAMNETQSIFNSLFDQYLCLFPSISRLRHADIF